MMELIVNFFSSYFHEDWNCDADTSSGVIAAYVQATPEAEVKILHHAIVHYLGDHPNDAELEDKLFSELGCYYRPTGDGVSARSWLLGLAQLLQEAKKRNSF